MNVSNGATQALAAPLADGTGALAAVLFPIAAVAVVGLLIGGFLLGKRKRDAELPPPRPDEQPRKPERRTHIETHDPSRDHPWPCAEEGCTRKFVRKTDLQRHHHSVHAKNRDHGCGFCGRHFSRKDTLRR